MPYIAWIFFVFLLGLLFSGVRPSVIDSLFLSGPQWIENYQWKWVKHGEVFFLFGHTLHLPILRCRPLECCSCADREEARVLDHQTPFSCWQVLDFL